MNNDIVKDKARYIWREVFHDSEAFIDLFFRDKYDEQNLVYRGMRDDIVAALHMLPYDVAFCNQKIRAGYLAGIATMPEYRGYGLATSMIKEAHRRLYDRGALLSFLIPADAKLADYYSARHDYSVCCKMELNLVESIHDSMTIPGLRVERISEVDSQVMQQVSRYYERLPMAVMHNVEDMATIFADLAIEETYTIAAYLGETLMGVLIAVRRNDKDDSTTDIEAEVLCISTDIVEVHNALLRALSECLQPHRHKIYERKLHGPRAGMGRPYAQMRVINALEMLRIWAKQNKNETRIYRIADPDIEENNACYRVHNGRCYIFRHTANTPINSPMDLTEELLQHNALMPSLMLD